MTHTYAELEVSRETYTEIATKLCAADYDQAFIDDDPDHSEATLDMHGIGLVLEGS
jgi:hypothetical protein